MTEPSTVPDNTAPLHAYAERIADNNLAPLWERLHTLITPEPASAAVAALWKYDEIRPLLMEAGELIAAKEAERRVLVLENPGLEGLSRITTSLYAGLQLVLPGEVAPAHRHTPTALRFVVDGEGAYTAVEGERTVMHEGDFVITPNWTWHDHGNESDQPMIWLDGLDVPMVQFFDASFVEPGADDSQQLQRPEGDSRARYGSGLMPVGRVPTSHASPIVSYPYARTRDALEQMRRAEEWDPHHGLRLRYTNPDNGDYVLPTIGTFIQLLPKGFETANYRSTDGTVFSVADGSGRTIVGDQVLEWKKRDTFVIPSWRWHRHIADDEAVLFSFSDRPIQEKVDLWREELG